MPLLEPPVRVVGDISTASVSNVQAECNEDTLDDLFSLDNVLDSKDVWYLVRGDGTTFTATTNTVGGILFGAVDSLGNFAQFTDFNVQLDVYCDNCALTQQSLTEKDCIDGDNDLAENDFATTSASFQPQVATVQWCTEAGVDYLLRVAGGETAAEGVFDLTIVKSAFQCISEFPCVNRNFLGSDDEFKKKKRSEGRSSSADELLRQRAHVERVRRRARRVLPIADDSTRRPKQAYVDGAASLSIGNATTSSHGKHGYYNVGTRLPSNARLSSASTVSSSNHKLAPEERHAASKMEHTQRVDMSTIRPALQAKMHRPRRTSMP